MRGKENFLLYHSPTPPDLTDIILEGGQMSFNHFWGDTSNRMMIDNSLLIFVFSTWGQMKIVLFSCTEVKDQKLLLESQHLLFARSVV